MPAHLSVGHATRFSDRLIGEAIATVALGPELETTSSSARDIDGRIGVDLARLGPFAAGLDALLE